MAGYLDEPELTRDAFDDEGFYRMGDAGRFADPDDPAAGIVFDGRTAEDFKLTTGTWVSVTSVRTWLISTNAGRPGAPRLLSLPYFALGDPEEGRANIADYYAWLGPGTSAVVANAVCCSAEEIKEVVASFVELGAEEMIFNPATDDPDDISRLADLIL